MFIGVKHKTWQTDKEKDNEQFVEYNLEDIVNYLREYGAKRIFFIDFTCSGFYYVEGGKVTDAEERQLRREYLNANMRNREKFEHGNNHRVTKKTRRSM